MKTRATTLLSLTITVIALIAATSAQGAAKSIDVPVGPQPHTLAHAKPFSKMSLSEIEHFQRHALARYLYVSRYFLHWRETHYVRYLLAADTRMSPCSATGVLEPANYCWYAKAARWTHKELSETRKRISERRSSATAGFPPHHALWVCIGGHEGSPTSINPNGHYGMLQMTYDWLGYIRGRASDYPQSVQEWAAEKAWGDNSYSHGFLVGQWLEWDGAYECLDYA